MKLDDRDIICEQDYTTLSNAELVAHIERYAGLMHSTPLNDGEWLDDISGPARVLLARAEAAEIELKERFDAMESIAKYQLIEMAALVAELEAALETTRQTLVALTARVAELTTERNTTGRRAFNAEAENQRLAAENRRLAARVAELEAASEPAIDRWASAARSETQLRLEAAEARVAELEAELASDAADENQWLDAYIESAAKDGATIKRLMARAAELEAQLAAQGWRPVTEKPPQTGQYQVALQSGNRRLTADHRAYYEDTGWVGPGVIFWRPIPPLPLPDTEATP